MGARTDFVRAMLIGVVIGIVITIAFFQLRGGKANLSASKPVDGSGSARPAGEPMPADAIARSREIQQLRARLAVLEAKHPDKQQLPDETIGMSTSDSWWQKLPENPAWDAARETKVIDRLAKYAGVKLDPSQIECKTRCCKIALPDETYEESLDDITSSIGLGFEPPDGIGTSRAGSTYAITACWSTLPITGPLPDRAAEREALLAKARDELAKCAQGVSPTITLRMQLHLDEHGQIEKVESNAKELGQKAASCAESALLQAAAFAPSQMSTRVPIVVPLGK